MAINDNLGPSITTNGKLVMATFNNYYHCSSAMPNSTVVATTTSKITLMPHLSAEELNISAVFLPVYYNKY